MPMQEEAPLSAPKAKETKISPTIDDEMLASRSINELIKYTVCIDTVTDISIKNKKPKELLEYEATTGQTLPDKYTLVDQESHTICGVYYAGPDAVGKSLVMKAALRDLGANKKLYIRDTAPVISNKNDFDISKKTPRPTASFKEKAIYKKILTSKKKIRNLYNYVEVPLSLEIERLMASRAGEDLPVRISVYEDPSASVYKGLAVIVFKDDTKHILPLKDITDISADIYDIKPDLAYIYK